MKKFSWLVCGIAMVLSFGIGISSCRKINEATSLGGGLVPEVDNINTFADTLEVSALNQDWSDSTTLTPYSELALGSITNDPEFGNSRANIYFSFGPSKYYTYPFYKRDSVLGVDSVVLSLGLTNIYGDSSVPQTVRVFEIDQNSGFSDTAVYTPKAPEFATVGGELGNKTFVPKSLYDTVRFIRARDTSYRINQLRVRIDPNSAFVNRLIQSDTVSVYRNFGTFYSAFRGLAVKSDLNGNALTYFNFGDTARTKLTVFFRVRRNGGIDTTAYSFYHGFIGAGSVTTPGASTARARGTQANTIARRVNNGGNWQNYLLNPGLQDKLYVQSDPGSQILLTIPGLSNYSNSNRVIQRAELIVTRLHTANETTFPAPPYLYLTRTTTGLDTMLVTDDSLSVSLQSGAINATLFGGKLLEGDDTYRFNLTRHVQNIVSRSAVNTKLKLFAPFTYTVRDSRFANGVRSFAILPRIAYGRVVLGGPANPDPAKKIRLRIIYSRI